MIENKFEKQFSMEEVHCHPSDKDENENGVYLNLLKNYKIYIALYLMLAAHVEYSNAQTCCSGGVPLAGGVRLNLGKAHSVQLQAGYHLNYLNTLSNVNQTIADNERIRYVHAVLLEGAYQVNQRLLFGLMLSGIQQYRENYQNQALYDASSAIGPGDGLLFGLYRFIERQSKTLDLEFAIKLPLGSTQKRSPDGFILPADMQPGTGSLDFLAGLKKTVYQLFGSSWSLQSGILFRRNGVNPDFREIQAYRFGHSLNAYTVMGRQFLIGNQLIDMSSGPQLRWMARDRVDNGQIPNTGGIWVDASIITSFLFNSGSRLSLGANLPVFRRLNGIQLTTTFSSFVRYYLPLEKNKRL